MKYIFEVRMKELHRGEYAQGWIEASEIIRRRRRPRHLPAPQDRRATPAGHRPLDSKAHRDAKDDSRSAKVKAILEKHARTCEITPLGEFEEPEWEVHPDGGDGERWTVGVGQDGAAGRADRLGRVRLFRRAPGGAAADARGTARRL